MEIVGARVAPSMICIEEETLPNYPSNHLLLGKKPLQGPLRCILSSYPLTYRQSAVRGLHWWLFGCARARNRATSTEMEISRKKGGLMSTSHAKGGCTQNVD